MPRVLRVAILGQGRSGRDIHGRHLSRDERFVIAAVADPLADRQTRARTEFGCDAVADYKQLLDRDDIDLFINSTPSNLHVPITLDIIEAGKNVVCEKPLARQAVDVDLLIAAAESKGVMFTVFQQSRFAPYYQKVKEVIDSGVLGRIVQVSVAANGFARRWDWQCLQANNGGNLLNTGPHPLDQALDLLSFEVPSVFCIMDRANTSGDAEDYVKLVMRAEGKPVVDLEVSSCSAYPSFTYNVMGTNGGLKASITHADWRWFVPANEPKRELVRTPLMTAEGLPCYCSESLTWHEESWEASPEEKDTFTFMSKAYYDMIYAHMTEGIRLVVTPQQVRSQIAVIEECHRQNPLTRLD